MADIPVFNEPVEHTIPSMAGLYQAAQTGYETGLKVPTVAGAIAKGITDAVNEAGKIAYQDAQTENLKADAVEKQAQAAYYLQGTKTQKDAAEIAYKQAQTEKLTNKLDTQQQIQAYNQKIAFGDPLEVKGMLDDGELQHAIITNPKEGPLLLGAIASKVGNDPEAKPKIDALYNAYKNYNYLNFRKSAQDVRTSRAIDAGLKADDALYGEGILQTWFPNAQSPEEYYKGQMYPNGYIPIKNGKRDEAAAPNTEGIDYSKYTLFDDKGNVIAEDIPSEKAAKYTTAKTGYEAQKRLDYDAVYGFGSYDRANQPAIQKPSGGPISNVPIPSAAPVAPTSAAPQATPQDTNENIVAQLGNKSVINPQASVNQNMYNSAKQKWATQFKSVIPPTAPQKAPNVSTTVEPKLYKPTSFEALSEATQMPVDVNIKTDYSIPEHVYTSINSNPLLADEPALLKGFAAVESGGRFDAKSPTGVVGLLQVTQATAKQYGFDRNIPEQQVLAAKAYLADLLSPKWFNGNLLLAAAAYNAGQGTIKDAVQEAGSTNWDDIKPYVQSRVSEAKWREVENYPERVIKAASQLVDPNSENDKTFIALLALNNLLTKTSLVSV